MDGWPEEWPSHPTHGHFIIAEGEWPLDARRIPASDVSFTVVPANDVEMIEFLDALPAQ